jgi:hypothetical protein
MVTDFVKVLQIGVHFSTCKATAVYDQNDAFLVT